MLQSVLQSSRNKNEEKVLKLAISLACIAALLSGCAGPSRPATGPGSGYGATYIPDVKPTPKAVAADYDATLAKCQKWARGLPFMPSNEHLEAVVVVSAMAGFAYGFTTPLVGLDFAAGGAVGASGAGGFGYWVETPERQRWYASQETMMVNCMTMSGYENNDPSVKVTYVKYDPAVRTVRSTGVDTFSAERLAKTRSCGIAPMADLVSKGPGFETYQMPCGDAGKTLTVRCEFGNCREIGPVLGAADQFQVGKK